MSRKFWIVVLSLGAVAGLAAGFLSFHRGCGVCGPAGYRGFGPGPRADAIAEICVRAAERVRAENQATGPRAPAPP